MDLTITKVNTPQDKLKLKAPYSMDPIGTTTHETGNIATAMAEISYMLGNNSSTGYHFAVDDTRAVQGLPLNRNAFHSGDGSTGRGNRKTIGVEHCYNWNGKTTTKNDKKYNPLYQKAIKNGIELQAQLFIQHPQWGEPKAGVNMFRHYDHNRKNCPQRIIEEGYWNTYVALVRARYFELKGVKAEPVKTEPTPVKQPTKQQVKKEYTGTSIVEYLDHNEIDSDFSNRKILAEKHNIKNYTGTASQNLALLNAMRGKKPVTSTPKKKTVAQMAQEVIAKKHGDGHENRRKSLGISATEYEKVRTEVNRQVGIKSAPVKPKKTIEQMAKEIVNNPKVPKVHKARQKWLGIDNATYQKVRARVNQLL